MSEYGGSKTETGKVQSGLEEWNSGGCNRLIIQIPKHNVCLSPACIFSCQQVASTHTCNHYLHTAGLPQWNTCHAVSMVCCMDQEEAVNSLGKEKRKWAKIWRLTTQNVCTSCAAAPYSVYYHAARCTVSVRCTCTEMLVSLWEPWWLISVGAWVAYKDGGPLFFIVASLIWPGQCNRKQGHQKNKVRPITNVWLMWLFPGEKKPLLHFQQLQLTQYDVPEMVVMAM